MEPKMFVINVSPCSLPKPVIFLCFEIQQAD